MPSEKGGRGGRASRNGGFYADPRWPMLCGATILRTGVTKPERDLAPVRMTWIIYELDADGTTQKKSGACSVEGRERR